jgi:hypothetical protein
MDAAYPDCPTCGRRLTIAASPNAFSTDVVTWFHQNPDPCNDVYGQDPATGELIRLGTQADVDREVAGRPPGFKARMMFPSEDN